MRTKKVIRKRKLKESFIQWLSSRLQLKIGNRISRGMEGAVYELDKKRVIKITDPNYTYLENFVNIRIDGIAQIYHVGSIKVPERFRTDDNGKLLNSLYLNDDPNKNVYSFHYFNQSPLEIELYNGMVTYIIMERIDTSVQKDIEELERKYSKYLMDPQETILFYVYELCMDLDEDSKDIQDLKRISPLSSDLIDLFYKLKNSIGNWEDIHSGQFGTNYKGDLVAIDTFELDTIIQQNKNIVKETKSSKDYRKIL